MLANLRKLKVTAEGSENNGFLVVLSEMGADSFHEYFQGNLVSADGAITYINSLPASNGLFFGKKQPKENWWLLVWWIYELSSY